jgi:hypothetical protein
MSLIYCKISEPREAHLGIAFHETGDTTTNEFAINVPIWHVASLFIEEVTGVDVHDWTCGYVWLLSSFLHSNFPHYIQYTLEVEQLSCIHFSAEDFKVKVPFTGTLFELNHSSTVVHLISFAHIYDSYSSLISLWVPSSISSLKNGVFWDVTPCGSCKNRRFRGT